MQICVKVRLLVVMIQWIILKKTINRGSTEEILLRAQKNEQRI
jgi:hypothetical protein